MDFLWSSDIGRVVMTFFVSMVPVIELRGAIPLGFANGLDIYTCAIVSVAGNMVPVPIIILFVRKVFAFLRTKHEHLESLVSRLEERANNKSELVNKYKVLGLIILVAIPLPGTGAWTGALVAAVMRLRLKTACPAIFAGVVIAAVIVSYVTLKAASLIV